MRILFISNLYPPNVVGGYEQLCFDVAEAFRHRGHEIIVLTSNYGSQLADLPGQEVSRTLQLHAPQDNIYGTLSLSPKERQEIDQSNIAQLNDLLAKTKPDCIFVWNLYFLSPSLVDHIEVSPLPSVFFLTDNWLAAFLNPEYVAGYFRTHVFSKPNRLKDWLYQLRPKLGLRRHKSHAIFSSHFMESYYKRASLSFTDARIIYNGVRYLDQSVADVPRPELAHKSGEIRLLFAGRVVEIKGVLTAIRALPFISPKLAGRPITLSIVGDQRDTPFCDRVRKLVKELQLTQYVSFSPSVAESELPSLFSAYDIYLFPSLYEPFSLTLLHAMNSGIPIVASSAGGNTEAIEHRKTGMIHSPDDHAALANAVVELIKNPLLAQSMSAAAKEKSLEFQFERMADKLDEYFRALVPRPK